MRSILSHISRNKECTAFAMFSKSTSNTFKVRMRPKLHGQNTIPPQIRITCLRFAMVTTRSRFQAGLPDLGSNGICTPLMGELKHGRTADNRRDGPHIAVPHRNHIVTYPPAPFSRPRNQRHFMQRLTIPSIFPATRQLSLMDSVFGVAELSDMIMQHLELEDYEALRQTCHLMAARFPSFLQPGAYQPPLQVSCQNHRLKPWVNPIDGWMFIYAQVAGQPRSVWRCAERVSNLTTRAGFSSTQCGNTTTSSPRTRLYRCAGRRHRTNHTWTTLMPSKKVICEECVENDFLETSMWKRPQNRLLCHCYPCSQTLFNAPTGYHYCDCHENYYNETHDSKTPGAANNTMPLNVLCSECRIWRLREVEDHLTDNLGQMVWPRFTNSAVPFIRSDSMLWYMEDTPFNAERNNCACGATWTQIVNSYPAKHEVGHKVSGGHGLEFPSNHKEWCFRMCGICQGFVPYNDNNWGVWPPGHVSKCL